MMTPEQIRGALDFLRGEMAKRHPPKILIVEDDPNDLALIMGQLTHFNCETLVAMDGRDALTLMDSNEVNLVLLDLRLPVLPGIQIIKQRKALDPDRHWIVVSGFKDSEAVDAALKAGAVLVLEKPVTRDQLSAILNPLPDQDAEQRD